MANVADERATKASSLPVVPRALVQRRTVLVLGLIVFIIAFLLLSGGMWAVTLHGLLTDGRLAVLWLLAAAGIGSLVPMPPSHESFISLRRVSAVAMGLGLMSLITLGLGLAGLLNRWTAWGLIALGIVALLVRTFRGIDRTTFESRLTDFLCADARHAWIWIPAVITLALACAASMALPGLLWNMFGDPLGYDVVEYHLQIPREWYEAGRIFPLHHNAFSFFPFNVEMHYLLAMQLRGGPWAGMNLAQLMHVGFVAMTVAAVAATARALGARPATAAVAALAAASTPWLLLLAPVAYNEGGLLLFGTLAVAWALVGLNSAADPSGQRLSLGTFALGGAFAGFACGTKLTAVPIVLLAVPAVVLVAMLARRAPMKTALGGPVFFGLAGVLTFSPWLIRNAVWAGNPVFPEAAAVLGKGHFTDVQVERWARAHSARPDQRSVGARAKAAVKEIGLDWRYGVAMLPVCAAVGVATLRSRRSVHAVLLALLAIQLVFWLGFTHLQSRFFVLAVPLAALLLATPTWRWWHWAASVVCIGLSALTWVRAGRVLDLENSLVDVQSPDRLAVVAAAGDEALAGRITAAERILLIGDAKVFWYPTPPGGVRYRTVFDVQTDDSSNVVEAWESGWMPTERDLVIIDAGELDRFAKTYWKIPSPASGKALSPASNVRP
jgi:hypothetical protein